MVKDIKIKLEDRPGALAAIGEALGRAGVNIEGFCVFAREVRPGEDRELVTHVAHLLVEDAAAARGALRAAGVRVEEERDVLIPVVRNRPGELGRICRVLADAGVNVDFLYTITDTRFVLGVDDMDKARRLL